MAPSNPDLRIVEIRERTLEDVDHDLHVETRNVRDLASLVGQTLEASQASAKKSGQALAVAAEAREAAKIAASEAAGARVDIRAQGETLADISASLIRLESKQAASAKGAAVGAAAGVGGVGGVVGVGAVVDALITRLPSGVAPWVVLALLVMIAAYVAARRFKR